jgi:heme/copper-type cytochrome/quinol oxidase subunit 2
MNGGIFVRLYLVLLLALSSAGCQLVEGIFRAGMWVGIIIVLFVFILVAFIASKFRRRRPRV